MTCHLDALCIDANDPGRLATFWAGVLQREVSRDEEGLPQLLPAAPTQFRIYFAPTDEPKTVPNQMHPDLRSSTEQEQQDTVARALELGGRHLDVGQRPEEGHRVLADPEGNEFCVIPAGNEFLWTADFIGALSSDGSRQVGHFWSEALGWPLVWDQDEETAIQAGPGRSIISWGGPPFRTKTGKNRWHLDIAPSADGDQQAEVERLEGLGGRRVDIGQGDVSWVVMADPDGNEFCVLTPR